MTERPSSEAQEVADMQRLREMTDALPDDLSAASRLAIEEVLRLTYDLLAHPPATEGSDYAATE